MSFCVNQIFAYEITGPQLGSVERCPSVHRQSFRSFFPVLTGPFAPTILKNYEFGIIFFKNK